MRDFLQIAEQLDAWFPCSQELWTQYHLKVSPYPPCSFDWGRCLAYHFDRGVPITVWLEIVEHVKSWVESRPKLKKIIKFVPFYEVGTDFFTQCKPPYDGGYQTRMYEEFLHYGSCRPAPWFYRQIAKLHERMEEARQPSRDDAREELLSQIAHATFIKPYHHLYWLDKDGWAVYQPNISTEDILAWSKLSES